VHSCLRETDFQGHILAQTHSLKKIDSNLKQQAPSAGPECFSSATKNVRNLDLKICQERNYFYANDGKEACTNDLDWCLD
jgi:hypothetical protein